MFELVGASDLCPEQRYKIIADTTYTGIYKGVFWRDDDVLIFRNVYGFRNDGYLQCFKTNNKFYKFISQKARIQSDMEQRALTTVLCRLLGDPHFQW